MTDEQQRRVARMAASARRLGRVYCGPGDRGRRYAEWVVGALGGPDGGGIVELESGWWVG